VTVATFLALLPMFVGMAAVQGAGVQPEVRRLVVQDEVILRVPVRPMPSPQFEWDERKGPKCVPTSAIRGALLSGPQKVDFVLPHRQRIRATFDDDCPALDYWGGFYLKTEDDQVCAKRDSVHSRMGGSCRIERFRHLVPKFKG
jgi:hypothetical protein